jgi:dTMP kinase
MKKALKIEFEGTDGAGKTTALKYFVEKLKERGTTVLETREVGNPHIPICVKLRETVLSPDSNLSGEAMELIFSAMRFENDRHYRALGDKYDMIVSDRGWFSHLAYTDHNVNQKFTEDFYLNFLQNYTVVPDVVIYFSVNTQTALKRRVKRGEGMTDVIEAKGVGYQELVRESFTKYLSHSNLTAPGSKTYIVDANDTIEGVQTQMDGIIDSLLGLSLNSANG